MPNQHTAYTPADNAWLHAHYATAERTLIVARFPGRKWSAVLNHASRIGASGRPAFLPLRVVTVWTPERVAVLRARYPTQGSAPVAAALGLSRNAVREQASRLKLRYVALKHRPGAQLAAKPRRLMEPKIKPPVRVPKVKINPAIVPLKKPDGTPLLAPKRGPGTPNLDAAKAARRQQEAAPKRAALITAEAIRKLPYNHPGRLAYSFDGQRGWQQWHQQQSTPTS